MYSVPGASFSAPSIMCTIQYHLVSGNWTARVSVLWERFLSHEPGLRASFFRPSISQATVDLGWTSFGQVPQPDPLPVTALSSQPEGTAAQESDHSKGSASPRTVAPRSIADRSDAASSVPERPVVGIICPNGDCCVLNLYCLGAYSVDWR